MVRFIQKYKHGLILGGYCLIYFVIFRYLESRQIPSYYVIHTVFDDWIPFCEFFIIPYMLWFPYMALAVVYMIFINYDKKDYYRMAANLMMGMTIFLLISWLYPNVQHLRPSVFPRDNMFSRMVASLYAGDTPTNILPSIHVFNSVAIYSALSRCRTLHAYKWVRRMFLILTILIVLSTMFLKQHSVVDVFMGLTLSLFGRVMFYPMEHPESSAEFTE